MVHSIALFLSFCLLLHANTVFKNTVSHVQTTQKVIALTFDNGPQPPYTNEILSVLKKHKVKATFFVIGKKAAKHSKLIKKIFQEGL